VLVRYFDNGNLTYGIDRFRNVCWDVSGGQCCGKVQHWAQQLEAPGFPAALVSLYLFTRRHMSEYTSHINQSRRNGYLSSLLIDLLHHANLRLHISVFVSHIIFFMFF